MLKNRDADGATYQDNRWAAAGVLRNHRIRPVEVEEDCCSHMELPAEEGEHRTLAGHCRIAVVHKMVATNMTGADSLLGCNLEEDNLGLENVIEEDIHNRRRHFDVAALRSRSGRDRTTLHFSEGVCVSGGVERTGEGVVGVYR